MESWLLAHRAYISSIEIEVQGMIALNKQGESLGESLAYDESAFQEKADEMKSIGDEIMKMR